MFIVISGMVGSGKSTTAARADAALSARGIASRVLRFQSLPCFRLLRSSPRTTRPEPSPHSTDSRLSERWQGYQRKPLTPFLAAVYLARIIAFRAYILSWRREEWRVLNRYFYDLFVHLRLTTAAERRYMALLRSVMPVPSLAVLVTARPETIAQRRPQYSAEYLKAVADGYRRLQAQFPHLIEIRTDPDAQTSDRIEMILAERLTRADDRAAR